MVNELVRLKRAGVRHFEVAWAYAVSEYPPSGMVLGPTRRSLLDQEECIHDFLRRRCELEWLGQAVDDSAAGLRALIDSGHEEYVVARRATHSHATARRRNTAVALVRPDLS